MEAHILEVVHGLMNNVKVVMDGEGSSLLESDHPIGLLSMQAARHQLSRSGKPSARSILAFDSIPVLIEISSYDTGRSKQIKQDGPCVASPSILRSQELTRLTGDRLHESSRSWLTPPDPSENQVNARRNIRDGSAVWFTLGNTFANWNAKGSLLWIHGKRT